MFANPKVLFANPKVLFANPKVLLVNPKVLLANPKVLLANPKVLLAVELNLVGGTYAERCKTRLYWPVLIGGTAWQLRSRVPLVLIMDFKTPSLVTNCGCCQAVTPIETGQ